MHSVDQLCFISVPLQGGVPLLTKLERQYLCDPVHNCVQIFKNQCVF